MAGETETPIYGFPIPTRGLAPKEFVDEALDKIALAIAMVETVVVGISNLAASKANASHTHSLAQVLGLVDALAGKMSASKTFTLAELMDVEGAAAAPAGYVLVKSATSWQVMSAAAAMGNHQHGVADIVGFDSAVTAKINALIAGAPGALDTLYELAAALGNDPNFATTVSTALAARALAIRSVAGAGLASGGGDLTADRTITVTKSTNPQAVAGIDDTTAMTPIRTKEAFDARALGAGQTWQNVSRAAGTSYQNTTGRPIQVVINGGITGNNNSFQVSTDNASWVAAGTVNDFGIVYSVVPNGHYYRLGGGSFSYWSELR
ncbi:hypothetical protein [Mesorhizobium sp. ANAO-SY3R2]|uniref:hypothetical protein n=1 Tax=Mesorhizobium sp. ANAO-SY3R2 TaxID=3166644 RepID=UPI0036715F7A